MNLNDVNVGQLARIVRVDEAHPVCQRLMSFGLLPGQVVTLRRVAPLNDPIAIVFNEQQIMLRRSEAAYVTVEHVLAAGATAAVAGGVSG